MPVTYDAVNNIITVTGFSESVPCIFDDLHNADLGGTLELMASKPAAMDMSLDRQVRPAESGALKLTIIITNYSPPNWNITLTGTDVFGNAQSEVININGDGSYVTVESWKTIDAGGIDCDGGATNGNVQIIQPRWGAVSKHSETSFNIDASLYIGDDVQETWFAEEEKFITFGATITNCINVWEYAHFRLGKLVSEPLKLGERGCVLASTYAGSSSFLLRGYDGSDIEIYSSKLASFGGDAVNRLRVRIEGVNVTSLKMYEVTTDHKIELGIVEQLATIDLHHITMANSRTGLIANFTTGTIQDFFIHSSLYPFYMFGSISPIIKNVTLKNNSYTAYLSSYDGIFTLINCDSDVWEILISGIGQLLRQYEFDAHVQDKDDNGLSGVSAVGEYISPHGQAFSVSTDVNGDIPTQTVDHGFFIYPSGSPEQLKTPLKVTYSKAGYQTVVKYYDLEEKTKDVVVLHKAVGVFISSGTPVINLKKTDPENKNVMVVG